MYTEFGNISTEPEKGMRSIVVILSDPKHDTTNKDILCLWQGEIFVINDDSLNNNLLCERIHMQAIQNLSFKIQNNNLHVKHECFREYN